MLISFGIKDIIIPKKQYRKYTMCEQNFFDYQDYENVFVRQRDEEIFTLKRFQVYQMYETEKQINERKEKEKKEYEEQTKNMINHSKPILSEKEMNYLENWSEMIYKEMIFDSDYCDWDWGKSSFDKRLLNRENYAIIIEDTENNIFGGGLININENLVKVVKVAVNVKVHF